MLLKIAFGLLAASGVAWQSQAPKCADFSGRYVIQHDDGRVYHLFRQTGCKSIRHSTSDDAQLRVERDTVVVALDGRWHRRSAKSRDIIRGAIHGDTLRIVVKTTRLKDTVVASQEDWLRKPNGDLCLRLMDGSRPYYFGAGRIGRDGEEIAASRSGEANGCP